MTSVGWMNSFKRVNMNTYYRIYFPECLLQIYSQLGIVERLYVGCTGIFDAMSYLWNNISPDMRTQLFSVIQEFYDESLQADE